MRRSYCVGFLASLILALCAMQPVAAVTISGHVADFEPRLRTGGMFTELGPHDPGPSVAAEQLRVGFQANFRIASAFFFQLPALRPDQRIVGADFSVAEVADTAATALTPLHNADLMAVGFTNGDPPPNGPDEGAAYYYVGEGAADTLPARRLIQDNFLVPSDFIPSGGTPAVKSTSAAGDAALLGYIDDLYANQATNGFLPGASYLILRVHPDVIDSGTKRYSLASRENVSGAMPPTLALEIFSSQLSGDVTQDGVVDLADLAALLGHFGRSEGSTFETGDFNADGKTSLADLITLQAHLGDELSQAGGITAVPEPSALAMAATLLACLLRCAAARRGTSGLGD